MKIILALLLVVVAAPLHGATMLTSPNTFSWDFTAYRTSTSTTSHDGSLALSFYGGDGLGTNEYILVNIFAAGSTVPFHSTHAGGGSKPYTAVVYMLSNSDVSLPNQQGRVEVVVNRGVVDVTHITLYIRDGTNEYLASISPNVHLIPEPSVAILMVSAGGLAVRRKR